MALQDVINFLKHTKGQISTKTGPQTPITQGLDIFVPFTEARRVQLVGNGSMLNGDIKQVFTISIAGANGARADVLTGKQSVASSSNNMWWNFPLVIKDSVNAATEALELGAAQERPMPLVRLSDLMEVNTDPVVAKAIEAILMKSEDTAGPSYYNIAKPTVEDPAQAFFVFSPSSSPDAPEGLWTNPPSNRTQNSAPSSMGTSPDIEVAG